MTVGVLAATAPDLGPLGESLLRALDAPGLAPLAAVVAVGAGALHALAPGHGKSLAAAYLIGSQGRSRDALLLGGTVAVMHTSSVLVIGLLWSALAGSGALDISGVSEVLRVLAAVLVLAAGAVLVRRRRHAQGHGHDHGHVHSHRHGHVPRHSLAPVPGAGNPPVPHLAEPEAEADLHGRDKIDRPGIVLLGASGGLVPSPAAFLLLLTGLFSGRTGLALLLVVLFGLGMAIVLSGVGLATLAGRNALSRRAPATALVGLLARAAPTVAAWGVLVAGCVLTVFALVPVLSA